jgi:hypothetical protein
MRVQRRKRARARKHGVQTDRTTTATLAFCQLGENALVQTHASAVLKVAMAAASLLRMPQLNTKDPNGVHRGSFIGGVALGHVRR